MLYDLVTCPHRVTRDLYSNPGERDEVNPFVQLLWKKGTLYEEAVIAGLKLPFLNLRPLAGDEKAAATRKAMVGGIPLPFLLEC